MASHLYRRNPDGEQILTQSESNEDARLSASPQWERVEGEPFGDPNDIRDPRNVRPNSPIEGATHESLGLPPMEDEEVVGDNTDNEANVEESSTSSAETVQSGDRVRVTRDEPENTDYDLRHG